MGTGREKKRETGNPKCSFRIVNALTSVLLAAVMLLSASCSGNGGTGTGTETSPYLTLLPEDTTVPESTAENTTAEAVPVIPSGAMILTEYSAFSNGGTDWAPAVTEAFKYSSTVFIPEGEYVMSEIKLSSGQTLCGAGEKTVIIQADDAAKLFNISGTRKKISDLAADMEDHGDSFLLKSTTGIKAGDRIYLLGQRNAMILEDDGREWCLGRSYAGGVACFYSEFLTVKSIAGNKVTTTSNTIFPYYYADGTRESDPLKPTASSYDDWPYRRNATTCWLMSMAENVTVRDMSVKNAHGFTIYALWAEKLCVSGLKVASSGEKAVDTSTTFVRLLECLDSVVTGCDFHVSVKPDVEAIKAAGMDLFGAYNLVCILSSSRCGFDGCSVDFGTHCIAIGKKHKEGVSTGCYVKNCTVTGGVWSGIWISQGGYETEISGNTVTGCPLGIASAARKTLISGNVIKGPGRSTEDCAYMMQSEGGTSGIVLTEGYSFDAVIIDNLIENVDTGLLVRDGYEKTNIFEYAEITFYGNTISFIKRSSLIWKNNYNKSGVRIELTLDKNTLFKQ